MPRKLSESNDLLQQVQKIFGEFIEPTAITQTEFYKLFKPKMSVGEGAYGTIKCVENCYSQLYAIKQSKDTQDTYGLYRQFSVMKKFNHPNLLKPIAFFQVKQTQKLIILMEYCKYSSLKTFSSNLTSLSLPEKIRLSVQIFNGIFALHHKNIMHRDLKPQNILIDQNKRAKICDFGFCTYDNTENLSKTQRVGTPLYNSPETDQGNYTKKCDIFSYGLIVYFIFSNGQHLFKRNQGSKDLETMRDQHFKNYSKSFEDLEAPQTIKFLLQNTITEKQKKRYSTQEVRQCWEKFIKKNNMKGIKVGEVKQKYGSMLFLDEQDQRVSERKASNILQGRQKLGLDLVLRVESHSSVIKDLQKLLKVLHSLANTQKEMAEFKTEIQKIDTKLTEKHILSFACLFILQIHFENLFELAINFMDSRLVSQKQNIASTVEEIVKKILQMRSNLVKNLTNSVTYLQRHHKLIKPAGLFSAFMLDCFEQSKKLQKFSNQGFGSKTEMQNLNSQRGIDSNRQLFETVLKQFKMSVNRSKFKAEIDDVIRKFRNEKCNSSSQNQIELADSILCKIKQVQFLKL